MNKNKRNREREAFIKKLLSDNKSKIPDKEILMSSANKRRGQAVINAVTERYGNEKVIYKPTENDKNIAYTDGRTIVVNIGSEYISEEETLEKKKVVEQGLYSHECGHVLFTDFDVLKKTIESWEDEKKILFECQNFPYYDKKIYKEMNDIFKDYPQLFESVVLHMQNIFEDAYIEDKVKKIYKGSITTSINYVKSKLQQELLDEVSTYDWKNYCLMVARDCMPEYIYAKYPVYSKVKKLNDANLSGFCSYTDRLGRAMSVMFLLWDDIKAELEKAIETQKILEKIQDLVGDALDNIRKNEQQNGMASKQTAPSNSMNGAKTTKKITKKTSKQGKKNSSNSNNSSDADNIDENEANSASSEGNESNSAQDENALDKGNSGDSDKNADGAGNTDSTDNSDDNEQGGNGNDNESEENKETKKGSSDDDGLDDGADDDSSASQSTTTSGKEDESDDSNESSENGDSASGESDDNESSEESDGNSDGDSDDESNDASDDDCDGDTDDVGDLESKPNSFNNSQYQQRSLFDDFEEESNEDGDIDNTDNTSDTPHIIDNGNEYDAVIGDGQIEEVSEDEYFASLDVKSDEIPDKEKTNVGEVNDGLAELRKQTLNEMMSNDNKSVTKIADEIELLEIEHTDFHKNVHATVHHITTGDREKYLNIAQREDIVKLSKNLQRKVEKELFERRKGCVKHNLYSGKNIDLKSVCNGSNKVFKQNKLPNNKPLLAASVLVDQSGSMGGDKIYKATVAAMLLEDFCRNLSIPFSITGHDVSRGVELYDYIEFGERNKNARERLVYMSSGGCNRDGYAIRYVGNKLAKRKEETKLLFVISDGLPNDNGYGTKELISDLNDMKKKYKNKGVVIVPLCIEESCLNELKNIYGSSLVDATDLKKFPIILNTMLAKELKKQLS